MEGLDKGGQGPISGCCAIEEEDKMHVLHIFSHWKIDVLLKFEEFARDNVLKIVPV
jgi:hypothetical protein